MGVGWIEGLVCSLSGVKGELKQNFKNRTLNLIADNVH